MTTYRSPADRRQGPNCGPTSIAVLTNRPLNEVMDHIAARTKKRANWKGKTVNPKWSSHAIAPGTIEQGDIFEALTHFGANPVLDADTNERFCGRQIITAAACLPQDRAYMILTGGHAQACVDGLIFDQNSGVEGDDPSEYWGHKKIVSLIVECDRLPETTPIEEPTPMTTTMTPIEIAANYVAELESVAVANQQTVEDAKASCNAAKIDAYGVVMAAMVTLRLGKNSKGAGEFRKAMLDKNLSPAVVKRFAENGAKAVSLKIYGDIDGSVTDLNDLAIEISTGLRLNGIETEAALNAVCFPKVKKTTVEALVKKAKGGTKTADEALQALLDAAAVINPAVQDVADTLVSAINQKIAA